MTAVQPKSQAMRTVLARDEPIRLAFAILNDIVTVERGRLAAGKVTKEEAQAFSTYGITTFFQGDTSVRCFGYCRHEPTSAELEVEYEPEPGEDGGRVLTGNFQLNIYLDATNNFRETRWAQVIIPDELFMLREEIHLAGREDAYSRAINAYVEREIERARSVINADPANAAQDNELKDEEEAERALFLQLKAKFEPDYDHSPCGPRM